MRAKSFLPLFALAALAFTAACDDDGVDSDEEARRAYLGLHESVGKSLQLGFDGFNAASSANIDPQMMAGTETGMLTISGQVDQGSSDNKGMRLYVGMVDYSDGDIVTTYEEEDIVVDLTYGTSEVQLEQPYLNLVLRNVPNGDYTGTLTGTYNVYGDIEAPVTLMLNFAGTIQAGTDGISTVRVPGGTTVTGTATSGDGVYEVSLTI